MSNFYTAHDYLSMIRSGTLLTAEDVEQMYSISQYQLEEAAESCQIDIVQRYNKVYYWRAEIEMLVKN